MSTDAHFGRRRMAQKRRRLIALALSGFLTGLLAVLGLFGTPAQAGATAMATMALRSAYRQFIDDFWPRARRAGIGRGTYRRAFVVKEPDWEVLARQRRQPEFHQRFADYLAARVSEKRIRAGVANLRGHHALLRSLQLRYGVDKHILLAVWGMESNYGTHTGRHNVIRALATLAIAGHQRRYARKQLLAALKILQRGDISPAGMLGSWAGAMGQTQFIPTTFLTYAVDADGDGRRDIWTSLPDALASTANYLRRHGWRRGRPWGWQVRVPKRVRRLSGRRHARRVRVWERLGVRPVNARSFFARDARAWLLRVRGDSRFFLVTDNFRALLAYNNAKTYALAVGLLADAIGRRAAAPPVPRSGRSLVSTISQAERARLRALAAAAASP